MLSKPYITTYMILNTLRYFFLKMSKFSKFDLDSTGKFIDIWGLVPDQHNEVSFPVHITVICLHYTLVS